MEAGGGRSRSFGSRELDNRVSAARNRNRFSFEHSPCTEKPTLVPSTTGRRIESAGFSKIMPGIVMEGI